MKARSLVPLAGLLALCAAAAPSGAGDAGDAEEAAAAAEKADLFSGFLVAANATDLYAPQATFRVRGWSSDRGNNKLMELAADGKEVKKGEVVARFEFIGRDALQWITDRIQKTEADAAQARLAAAQTLDSLTMDRRRKELAARLAALDVQREKAISRRQAELYKIQQKIADFEVEALDERIAAAQNSKAAELSWQDLNVNWVHDDMSRYRYYEKAFQVFAPHDGIVRHAFNPNERRKIQKGDSVMAGQKAVSLARDAKLEAKFFVPEHRIAEIQVGTEMIVTTNTSKAEHKATVSKIDFFPQELGFLMESPNLPNGQEKAFAVTATLAEAPEGVTAGTEIRAKARAAR